MFAMDYKKYLNLKLLLSNRDERPSVLSCKVPVILLVLVCVIVGGMRLKPSCILKSVDTPFKTLTNHNADNGASII